MQAYVVACFFVPRASAYVSCADLQESATHDKQANNYRLSDCSSFRFFGFFLKTKGGQCAIKNFYFWCLRQISIQELLYRTLSETRSNNTPVEVSMIEKSSHYDDNYFNWQKDIGKFGGWANVSKFEQYIKPTDNVLDFGCGGGFLLSNIQCHKKIGVEINDSARENATQLGIMTFSDIDQVDNEWADVILSDNALEHTSCPYSILTKLFTKLRPQGLIIFVVPCDSVKFAYREKDINQHFFSWSPMNIGNIFTHVGFKVISSEPYLHKWPPYYTHIAKYLGKTGFELCAKAYGWYKRDWSQVRIVAKRG